MLFRNLKNINRRKIRHRRLRGRISGTADKPRLFVFRSHQHIYAQLIDDQEGRVMVSASDLGLKDKGKIKRADKVGQEIAKKLRRLRLEKWSLIAVDINIMVGSRL